MTNELYHHGILGQKWGVRRYQNFDGSYTQAGVKRYSKSSAEYVHQKERYSSAKEAYKTGQGSKADKVNAKISMSKAKKQMNKDYRHLRLDKKADKGKELYAKGYRITNGNNAVALMKTAGALSMAISKLPPNVTGLGADTRKLMFEAGLGAEVLGFGVGAISEIPNNKLRAYYSHTSNY